jgi:hypothetical protein
MNPETAIPSLPGHPGPAKQADAGSASLGGGSAQACDPGGCETSVNRNQEKERIGSMSDKTKAPASELFDQATKNYEQTLRTGLKYQEEASRWLTNALTQATSAQDWQKRVTNAANDVITPTQKRLEEYLALIEQNNRTNVDLLKKATEASQVATAADAQAKYVDFVEASAAALQANVQAVTQMNTRMVDSWVTFIKKNNTEFSETKTAKAS